MRINADKMMAKHQLDLQRSAGIKDHPLHDQFLCDYADAAAAEVYNALQEEIPKIVSETVDKYMASNNVQIKVDEASVKSVKTKISELLSGLFR